MSTADEPQEASRPCHRGVWVGLLLGAVVLSLSAAAFWGGFRIGARSIGDGPAAAIATLQLERDALSAELAEARQQGIACERGQQIEQEKDRSAQAQLKAAQDERLTLAKEVSSLKRLIRSGGRGAVAVQDLRLAAGEAAREFKYSFTVSQLIEGVGETSGSIVVKLVGKQGGKAKTLALKQLKGSQPTRLEMRFDHFQTIDGRLVLPAGFEPQTFSVEIDPAGDKLIASVETFPWRVGP